MNKQNRDATFSLRPFFIVLISVCFILNFVLPEIIIADETSSCKANPNLMKKFEKQAQQMSRLLSRFGGYEKLTVDISKIKCYEKVVEYPITATVIEVPIISKNTRFRFRISMGDKISLTKRDLINKSLTKFSKAGKVKTGPCEVSSEIFAKMREKSIPILKVLTKSEEPDYSYRPVCREYSTPEFNFKKYVYSVGDEGEFEVVYDKNLELIQIFK